MLWLLIMATALGVLLGALSLRVHAVLIASCIVVALGILLIPLAHVSLLKAVAATFGLLAALQCGYLAGLILSSAATRCSQRNEDRRNGSPRHDGPPKQP
jgi:hypothetical protein